MHLLRDLPQHRYPTDYLLARLRGRRGTPAALAPQAPLLDEQDARHTMHREFHWVYRQMDQELRNTFAPVLLFFELNTLVLCLRYKAAPGSSPIKDILAESLLSKEIRQILLRQTELPPLLKRVERCFVALSTTFTGLEPACSRGGLREMERFLLRAYLEYAVRAARHPAIRDFFAGLIDQRNIMGLLKQWRWRMETAPQLINGGRLKPRRLRRAMAGGRPEELALLIKPRTGALPSAKEPGAFEAVLLRSTTARLRRAARTPEPVCQIIDYLWQQYIEARNLGLQRHGERLDRETLAKELVQ